LQFKIIEILLRQLTKQLIQMVQKKLMVVQLEHL
jgi:hypothetical protein